MRTTLTLDEDVFLLAQQMAKRGHVSMGKALSMLVRERQGLDERGYRLEEPGVVYNSKYSVYPKRGEVITSEHVYKLMDEEGI